MRQKANYCQTNAQHAHTQTHRAWSLNLLINTWGQVNKSNMFCCKETTPSGVNWSNPVWSLRGNSQRKRKPLMSTHRREAKASISYRERKRNAEHEKSTVVGEWKEGEDKRKEGKDASVSRISHTKQQRRKEKITRGHSEENKLFLRKWSTHLICAIKI